MAITLDEFIGNVMRREGFRISGIGTTSITLAQIKVGRGTPFILHLDLGDALPHGSLWFKVPRIPGHGKNDPTSRFRKCLVITDVGDQTVLLHWAPYGQDFERGFDVLLDYTQGDNPVFVLTIRQPETFPEWADQLNHVECMADPR